MISEKLNTLVEKVLDKAQVAIDDDNPALASEYLKVLDNVPIYQEAGEPATLTDDDIRRLEALATQEVDDDTD